MSPQTDLAAAFDTVVHNRRSVRAFLDRPVPQALIEQIFTLAQQAPSNCNTQPWQTWVVSGAKRDRLAARIKECAARNELSLDIPYLSQHYSEQHKARMYDAAAQLYGALGIARGDKAARQQAFARNFDFFGAPHVALLFLPAWANEREAGDTGMYAQTLMLALTAHGLASCPQTALGMFSNPIKEELGIGAELKLFFGISFGYEDAQQPINNCRVGRAELAATTHFVSD
jgi:nitroreductase